MKATNGFTVAAKDHLLSGNRLTRLEAIVLFGVANLPDLAKEMRRQGVLVKSRNIPYAAALVRLNKTVKVETPKNLPIREITLTEYWVSK